MRLDLGIIALLFRYCYFTFGFSASSFHLSIDSLSLSHLNLLPPPSPPCPPSCIQSTPLSLIQPCPTHPCRSSTTSSQTLSKSLISLYHRCPPSSSPVPTPIPMHAPQSRSQNTRPVLSRALLYCSGPPRLDLTRDWTHIPSTTVTPGSRRSLTPMTLQSRSRSRPLVLLVLRLRGCVAVTAIYDRASIMSMASRMAHRRLGRALDYRRYSR